jgi:hypothetical protein
MDPGPQVLQAQPQTSRQSNIERDDNGSPSYVTWNVTSEPVEHLERQRALANARSPCKQGGRALDETAPKYAIERREPR